jgi:hypothetical protein
MNAYIFVYTFLAILIGAMVYVIGTPWIAPRPRNIRRNRSREDMNHIHG